MEILIPESPSFKDLKVSNSARPKQIETKNREALQKKIRKTKVQRKNKELVPLTARPVGKSQLADSSTQEESKTSGNNHKKTKEMNCTGQSSQQKSYQSVK